MPGSTFSFICGCYFTPQTYSSQLLCASPGPVRLVAFVSLLWVTFLSQGEVSLLIWDFSFPLSRLRQVSPCHSVESPFATGSSVVFTWLLPHLGPPLRSPGPSVLLAAAIKAHLHAPLLTSPSLLCPPLSAQGLLARPQWVEIGPG